MWDKRASLFCHPDGTGSSILHLHRKMASIVSLRPAKIVHAVIVRIRLLTRSGRNRLLIGPSLFQEVEKLVHYLLGLGSLLVWIGRVSNKTNIINQLRMVAPGHCPGMASRLLRIQVGLV
jgi:hypothetical protein